MLKSFEKNFICPYNLSILKRSFIAIQYWHLHMDLVYFLDWWTIYSILEIIFVNSLIIVLCSSDMIQIVPCWPTYCLICRANISLYVDWRYSNAQSLMPSTNAGQILQFVQILTAVIKNVSNDNRFKTDVCCEIMIYIFGFCGCLNFLIDILPVAVTLATYTKYLSCVDLVMTGVW